MAMQIVEISEPYSARVFNAHLVNFKKEQSGNNTLFILTIDKSLGQVLEKKLWRHKDQEILLNFKEDNTQKVETLRFVNCEWNLRGLKVYLRKANEPSVKRLSWFINLLNKLKALT